MHWPRLHALLRFEPQFLRGFSLSLRALGLYKPESPKGLGLCFLASDLWVNLSGYYYSYYYYYYCYHYCYYYCYYYYYSCYYYYYYYYYCYCYCYYCYGAFWDLLPEVGGLGFGFTASGVFNTNVGSGLFRIEIVEAIHRAFGSGRLVIIINQNTSGMGVSVVILAGAGIVCSR